MDELTMITDEEDYEPEETVNPDELEEIADTVQIGDISLTPGEAFCYTLWGVVYRYLPGGERRVDNIAFGKRGNAKSFMDKNYSTRKGMEAHVEPVKKCLLLHDDGHIKSWVEVLTR